MTRRARMTRSRISTPGKLAITVDRWTEEVTTRRATPVSRRFERASSSSCVVPGPAGRRIRTRPGTSPAFAAFVATFSALLVLPHPAGGQDLGVYAPEPIGEKESGLQMELYKFYSPLYSIPNLSARPPDLVTHLGQINKPGTFGTWPEVYAISASTSPGFGQYDGRTYSARWAARITGQLLVERTNTFTFELDNREGAKLYLDGRLCIDNDWNVRDTGETAAVVKQNKVHLAAGYHNIRVEFFVDSTWTQLRLWYSGPGFPRQVVPANKFFAGRVVLPLHVQGRAVSRRGLRHGRGGLFVAERRASDVTESTVARGEDRGW